MSRARLRPASEIGGCVQPEVLGPSVGGVPDDGIQCGAPPTAATAPVVLVHGLRTSCTMWRAQVEALTRAGHHVVAVDLPGHGSRRGERFTRAGAEETVVRAVDEVGGSALVVGLSLGGYVAIAHAARHPAQVLGLVAASCCTRPRPSLLGAWALGAALIARLPDGGAWVNQVLVDRLLPAAGAADVGGGGFALEVMGDVLREMRGARPLEDLAQVAAPVWLVNGRFDHFRGEERAFLRACRRGRLVVVPGATHLVSLVRPTRFTRVVLEALDEVERTASAGRTAAGRWTAGTESDPDGPGPDAAHDPGLVRHDHDVVAEPVQHLR